MTEKEKMLAGELYDCFDPELCALRAEAHRLMEQFNTAPPEKREEHFKKLVHAEGTCKVEPPFRCDYGSNIYIGNHFYANFNCTILDDAKVTIGSDVLFGPNVQLLTPCHPIDPELRAQDVEFELPITIGNRVWLGGGVTVCPGVTIGDNCVIGAGSVVVKDIPANSVAAGNPARVIRSVFDTQPSRRYR